MSYWNNKTPRHSALFWGLLFSVLAHVTFLIARIPVWYATDFADTAAQDTRPIEIAEIPPEVLQQMLQQQRQPKPKPAKTKDLEIAETEDAGNRELDPDAKILSDRTQTAREQMRAQNIDDFRAKKGTGAKGFDKEQAALPPTGSGGEAPSEDGIGEGTAGDKAAGVKRDWQTLSLKDLGLGGDGGAMAATDDRLSDVPIGERTILSTREFRYFSYYHRIKELLRQYWKPSVERQLAKIWGKGGTVREDEMVTKVLVLLDTKGRIQKISRLSSSGVVELDQAAVEAFQKAGPFPNPPKGMLDEDGFVRIRWDFILKTEAAPAIQFRSAGSGARGGAGP